MDVEAGKPRHGGFSTAGNYFFLFSVYEIHEGVESARACGLQTLARCGKKGREKQSTGEEEDAAASSRMVH